MAFDALPVESNQLYTPYIDLRAAALDDVQPYVLDGPAGLGDDLRDLKLPDGVFVETMAGWLSRDPAGFRAVIEGGGTLPANDKLAHLARGFWSHGRHVEIADGVHLAAPIELRWPAAAPGRALITRTIVTLGKGATASLVEEQVASGPPIACAEGETVPQGFFHGTTEVVLAAGASLAMASIQDLPGRPGRVPASARRDRRRRDRCIGRWPSSAAASSGRASTIASRGIAARSSRWRSCSAASSSCST